MTALKKIPIIRWGTVLVLLLVVRTVNVLAQSSSAEKAPQPIAFDCQCTDPVGAAYAEAFRQTVAASGMYTLTPQAVITDSHGNVKKSYWHISVMSMDPSPKNLGQYTVLSVVILLGSRNYMLQDMQACSKTQIKTCAQTTLQTLSQFQHELGY